MNNKEKILELLLVVAEWGLDDRREAWVRALAFVEKEKERFKLEESEEEKVEIREEMKETLEEWLEPILDQGPSPDLLKYLEASPEEVWKGMTFMNHGIF